MRIDIYPNICKVTGSYQELSDVREILTVEVPGAKYTQIYRRRQWDGKKRFFNLATRTFPVGLLEYVVKEYKGDKEVIDKRVYKPMPIELPKMKLELRDYQITAVTECLRARNCIVESATNSGKTAMFAALVKKMNDLQYPTLILIHRSEILKQICSMVKEYTGLEIGFITAQDVLLKNVVVGMTATLVNRIGVDQEITDFFKKVYCVIVDETHHATSKSISSLLAACPAIYRFGFSGTIPPVSTYEGMLVRSYLGSVVLKISNEEMINRGVSAKPLINIYEIDSKELLRGVFSTAKSTSAGKSTKDMLREVYRLSILYGIIQNQLRNSKVLEIIANHPDSSHLIVVDMLEHGGIIKRLLDANGIQSEFISGASEVRVSALNSFKQGKLKVLISTNIIDEGVDISKIDVLIMLAGKKSKRQLLQRVGRSLRKKEGENKVTIYDFMDYGSKYLERHAKRRIQIYREEGFELRFL